MRYFQSLGRSSPAPTPAPISESPAASSRDVQQEDGVAEGNNGPDFSLESIMQFAEDRALHLGTAHMKPEAKKVLRPNYNGTKRKMNANIPGDRKRHLALRTRQQLT